MATRSTYDAMGRLVGMTESESTSWDPLCAVPIHFSFTWWTLTAFRRSPSLWQVT